MEVVRVMLRRLMCAILGIAILLAGFTSTAVSVRADARDFDLVNNSAIAIASIYVAPSDSNDWEEDILGTDVLPAGQTVHISFSDNLDSCVYDIKVMGR